MSWEAGVLVPLVAEGGLGFSISRNSTQDTTLFVRC